MTIAQSALDVRVNRPAADPSGFQWKVLDSKRQILAASTRLYASDREALHAGNVAARAILRTGRCQSTPAPIPSMNATAAARINGDSSGLIPVG